MIWQDPARLPVGVTLLASRNRQSSSSATRGFRPKCQASGTTEVQSQRWPHLQYTQNHLSALTASKDHAHGSSVQREFPEHRLLSAAGAGDLQIGRLESKKARQRPSGRISIELCPLICHRVSPVGPKRSVLMADSPWPRPTNWSATVSTNAVGPHKKIWGISSGWKPHWTSMSLSTRRVWPCHPGGAPRVSVCTRWKPSRLAASRSNSSR